MMMEKLDDRMMDCISGGVSLKARAAVNTIPAGAAVVRLKDLSTQDLQCYLTGACPKCRGRGCLAPARDGGADCTNCSIHYSLQ